MRGRATGRRSAGPSCPDDSVKRAICPQKYRRDFQKTRLGLPASFPARKAPPPTPRTPAGTGRVGECGGLCSFYRPPRPPRRSRSVAGASTGGSGSGRRGPLTVVPHLGVPVEVRPDAVADKEGADLEAAPLCHRAAGAKRTPWGSVSQQPPPPLAGPGPCHRIGTGSHRIGTGSGIARLLQALTPPP